MIILFSTGLLLVEDKLSSIVVIDQIVPALISVPSDKVSVRVFSESTSASTTDIPCSPSIILNETDCSGTVVENSIL